MEMTGQKQAVLLLEDGTEFLGVAAGADGEVLGEVVFSTNAVGFQESVTDPSYEGQLLVQTFPLTGNVGANHEDSESERVGAAGYIARELCEVPSNFRCEGTLDAFLVQRGVVGICGLDTRALTIHLREHGRLNGAITPFEGYDKTALLARLKAHGHTGAVERVSRPSREMFAAQGAKQFSVTLYDLGCKQSILHLLTGLGCEVNAVPYHTPLDEVLAQRPNGIVLAGGPGDPADYKALAERFAPLLQGNTPVFAQGLGHQLLAMAAGASTLRLAHGHRGGSQPVKDMRTGRTFVTAQNHGFAVDGATLAPTVGTVICTNLNDQSCEGIAYANAPVLSIQFHPEAFTGTADTCYYPGLFVELMRERKGEAANAAEK